MCFVLEHDKKRSFLHDQIEFSSSENLLRRGGSNYFRGENINDRHFPMLKVFNRDVNNFTVTKFLS